MSKHESTPPVEVSLSSLGNRIYTIRGCQVMLDSDLSEIYQVEIKNLKRAVKRNIERFPADFMFELNKNELELLRCQFGTSSLQGAEANNRSISGHFSNEEGPNKDTFFNLRCQIGTSKFNTGTHGGSRYAPFAFTESGVAMLSSVLNSKRAIQVNIAIMRVFIHLRTRGMINQGELVSKLEQLQKGLQELHNKIELPSPKLSKQSQGKDKVKMIQEAVAQYWGLDVEDLKSKKRTRALSLARHVAIYILRTHLGLGLQEIGLHFGQRDHTTILHAYRKILISRQDNASVANAVSAIQDRLAPLSA